MAIGSSHDSCPKALLFSTRLLRCDLKATHQMGGRTRNICIRGEGLRIGEEELREDEW
jgi:hypothetical protein